MLCIVPWRHSCPLLWAKIHLTFRQAPRAAISLAEGWLVGVWQMFCTLYQGRYIFNIKGREHHFLLFTSLRRLERDVTPKKGNWVPTRSFHLFAVFPRWDGMQYTEPTKPESNQMFVVGTVWPYRRFSLPSPGRVRRGLCNRIFFFCHSQFSRFL